MTDLRRSMGRIERTRRVGKSRRAPPLTESWRPHYNRRRHAFAQREDGGGSWGSSMARSRSSQARVGNIGRATVLKLASEGAHVVVNARTNQAEADAVVREAQARGVKAISVIADVAKRKQG